MARSEAALADERVRRNLTFEALLEQCDEDTVEELRQLELSSQIFPERAFEKALKGDIVELSNLVMLAFQPRDE